MKVIWAVPIIASILILGTFSISNYSFGDSKVFAQNKIAISMHCKIPDVDFANGRVLVIGTEGAFGGGTSCNKIDNPVTNSDGTLQSGGPIGEIVEMQVQISFGNLAPPGPHPILHTCEKVFTDTKHFKFDCALPSNPENVAFFTGSYTK